MNTRADIHRELFGRLKAWKEPDSPRPGPDVIAFAAMALAGEDMDICSAAGDASGMRQAAMDMAVASLRLVYSLDDALS